MRREQFLLFRIREHSDQAAYEELYNAYLERIRRYIFFRVPKAEDADELTAEVFLRALEYVSSTRVEHASALFYRIARTLVADFYRKRKLTEPLNTALHVEVSGRQIEEDIDLSEEKQQLIKTITSLRDVYRDVLTMFYLDQMSIKEIALSIEKSSGAVRVLLHRARKALKQSYERPSKTT
ncbi:MAG: sigma-70 family RNA polymerase sigma factor [bacterium]|nr:sigma-70 family RNA polymerase sigma factor [bacterium]